MLVLGNAHKKRNLQNMSKFLGEISKYFKGSQNMVKKRRNLAIFCTKGTPSLGTWRFSFPSSKPSFRKSWNSEKKISRIHQCWRSGEKVYCADSRN